MIAYTLYNTPSAAIKVVNFPISIRKLCKVTCSAIAVASFYRYNEAIRRKGGIFTKTIAIAAVTAGGKTTLVNALQKRLPGACSLHFDDYTFEGEVEDFHQWVLDGANYNVWNLAPLEEDILRLRESGSCELLLLDYPFAYLNDRIAPLIDRAVFLDTPLDVAMARRVLRDMKDASAEEIRQDMELYLSHARIAYIQMLKDVLPSSDDVIDGLLPMEDKVAAMLKIINTLT